MANTIAIAHSGATRKNSPAIGGESLIESLELLKIYEGRVRHLWTKLFEARGQAKDAARLQYQDAYVTFKRQQQFIQLMTGEVAE